MSKICQQLDSSLLEDGGKMINSVNKKTEDTLAKAESKAMEDIEKRGLEGTGLELPPNRHGNLTSASSDQNFLDILRHIKSSKTPTVINYGASWCRVCSQMLPPFCRLSNEFPKLSFVYADIDECPETTQHIRCTPTFQFYRDGERVDEMYGAGEERLHDRLWLHSDL